MVNKKKLLFTLFVFVALFGLVLSKAFYVQVLNRGKLLSYAQSQFVRKVKKFPPRGNILDRNGSPLAINIPTYNIFTIPKLNHDKLIYKNLSKVVPELAHNKILSKIKGRKNYTVLARKLKLSQEQVEKIKDLEGIYLEKEFTRFYPGHELMAQTIGYMGQDNNGLSGLELKFNKELIGKEVEVKFYRDAKGRPIKYENNDLELEKLSHDLVLSVDRDLQGQVEKVLKEGVEENKARKAGMGIIDASTGEILAMANYPSYDANSPKLYDDHLKRLSFITDPFEPGSVFKTLVVAGALEEKVATAETKFYCEKGKMKIGNHTISEAEAHEQFEWLSVEDILRYSSNIGSTKIAFELGYSRLRKELKAFGIGEKTGIEIPGESKGIVNNKENITKLSLSNISFGHGVAVTGLQLLSTYAAIANDGIKVTPTILKRKDDEALPLKRIMDSKTAQALEKMLTKAVQEGTGTNAIIPYFKVAGKTGTAQRVSENGGYSGYVASFIGYPVNLPKKFVIFVYVDDPRDKFYYGNAVAAPLFKKIAQYMLYKNKEFSTIAQVEVAKEVKPLPALNHVGPAVPAKAEINNMDNIHVVHAASRIINGQVVPNFLGLDKKASMDLASELKLKIVHQGFGVVTSQSLEPGVAFDEDVVVKLNYTAPTYE
ncbi:MAG: penicillin-binding transpeptidase domain-containing protein [Bacteriovoracaceae bacterium]